MKRRTLRHLVSRALAPLQLRLSSTCLAKHKVALALVILLLAAAGAVVLCSALDHTFTIEDGGKGFLDHYGIWAIFVGSPILVLLASATRLKFAKTVRALHQYTVGGLVPGRLRALVKTNLESIDMKTRTRYVFWLFLIVGWYYWLVNVDQTIYPFDSYGNDVFDAYPHLRGFFAFKFYLAILWVFVYPALSYLAGHIFISMILILKYMSDHKLFRLDFFHEDDCGGISVFGTINALLLSMTFTVFVTVLAILFTHEGNYASIWTSVIISFILIVVQSFLGVYYIHIFVRQKKREVLDLINRILNRSLLTASNDLRFPQDLLLVRNHITQIKSIPYAKGALVVVNFLRLSPAAAGLANIILRP